MSHADPAKQREMTRRRSMSERMRDHERYMARREEILQLAHERYKKRRKELEDAGLVPVKRPPQPLQLPKRPESCKQSCDHYNQCTLQDWRKCPRVGRCTKCGKVDSEMRRRGGLCLDCYAVQYCQEHPVRVDMAARYRLAYGGL